MDSNSTAMIKICSLSNDSTSVLSYMGTNTILTITFLVGESETDESKTINKL